MSAYKLTPEALDDLLAIWEFIAEDSYNVADRVLEDFYRAFGQLAEMPGMGHKREDLTKQNVLFWRVHSYLVIYKENTSLLIVAVLHGSRDVKKILKQRRSDAP